VALLALDLSSYLDSTLNILYVALGLGLVIFFHELGHFAVAKWCDVHVERFSIGFGPILWSRKKGETEYALSAVPFGGYVKMLGQDDMDPSQLSSEEIAQDPRSYSAKPVWMRMAIISAGVIMNVVTAVLFYAIAFGFGVEEPTPAVGALQVGMPAWVSGLQPGDRIEKINGHTIESYDDIVMEVAISKGPLEIEGRHLDDTKFKMQILPNEEGRRRRIGFAPELSLKLIKSPKDEVSPIVEGAPAASAEPPFEPGDTIRRIDGTDVSNYAQFYEILCSKAGKPVVLDVQRDGADDDDLTSITVPPGYFRTLGLQFEIGRIAAVQKGSPAEAEGLKAGDRITKINGKAVGTEIDPLRLPDLFSDAASATGSKEVTISYSREIVGGAPEEKDCHIVPRNKPAWLERPDSPGDPLSIPAIGVAYRLIPTVLNVDENGPAAGLVQKGDLLKKLKLVLPEGAESEGPNIPKTEISFDLADEKQRNLEHAFWMMQMFPQRTVELTVVNNGEERTVSITPKSAEATNWYLPTRGVHFNIEITKIQAGSIGDSFVKGAAYTRKTLIQMYLTLRNLFTGHLSYKELGGPIRIAKAAYYHAQGGLPLLSLFLGLLSVNLAVLNFLPIPVLDGGHMVFLCWEAITRKKPSERVLVAATYVGMAFVLGLMITVLCLDIFVHGGG
jgi:regulator of sigma E protease